MAIGQAGDGAAANAPVPDTAGWDGVPVMTPGVRDRLNTLRDEVHLTLHREFSTTAEDLDQLRRILADAAEKLSLVFCEMTRGSTDLVRLIGELPPAPEASPLIEAAAIAQDISSRTSTTVQSLQFEDMAAQLLQHVGRRLATLEAFSREMSLLHPDPKVRPVPLTDEVIDQLYTLLEQHRADLASVGHKSVQQQSLESGVVELF